MAHYDDMDPKALKEFQKQYKKISEFLNEFGESTKTYGGSSGYTLTEMKKKANNYILNNQEFHKATQFDGMTRGKKSSDSSENINPLHKFATYNTLFTLSALTDEEIRNPEMYLGQKPVHDVIAQSAGIGPNFRTAGLDPFNIDKKKGVAKYAATAEKTETGFDTITASQEILKRNHDLYFENVNITSTVSPNEERNTMSFTKMEFELHEPGSITFVERIRAAAYNSGFLDYQDAPYLLTIEWKGNNKAGFAGAMPTAGGELSTGFIGDTLIRKIPIVISRVEFDVNAGGAVYLIQAAAYSEFGMMDRFHLTRHPFTIKKARIQTFLQHFALEMQNQQETEMNQGLRARGYEDVYVFEMDPKLERLCKNLEAPAETTVHGVNREEKEVKPSGVGSSNPKATNKSKTTFYPAGKSFFVNSTAVPANTSVLKVLEDTIMSSKFFQNLTSDFWQEYLLGTQILSYSSRKNMKWDEKDIKNGEPFKPSNAEELAGITAKNTMIPWFKIISTVHTNIKKGIDPITRMYPKTIIYKAVHYEFHILKLIMPGMSIGKVNWESTVKKRYNYFYTGENVDIQNLRVNYKTGYYHRNIVKKPSSATQEIVSTIVRGWDAVWGADPAINQLEVSPLRSYPSITSSKNLVEGTDTRQAIKTQEFFDYLVNPNADMMKLEMEILGDPSYIAQDMYVTINGNVKARKPMNMHDGAWNDQLNCFNVDNSMPLIHLTYRMPADIRERKGTMFDTDANGTKTAESNLFFSGIYQVSKVESSIKNGAFTQILFLVRLNNQQGIGAAPFKVEDIAWTDSETEAGDNNVNTWNGNSMTDYLNETDETDLEFDYQKKWKLMNENIEKAKTDKKE